MLSAGGVVSADRERTSSRELCDRMRVKTPSIYQIVGLLSGGNQQKVVLGKWLARTPRVLILDEPTRGVDVGARSEIYGLMDKLAGDGVGSLDDLERPRRDPGDERPRARAARRPADRRIAAGEIVGRGRDAVGDWYSSLI